MLEVEGLHAGYGETRILHGVSFAVGAGRVRAVLGRNGVGKTTTLKTIMGLLPAKQGAIRFGGRPLAGRRPYEIARLGIGYVPETRDIFSALTVRENLELPAAMQARRGGPWTLAAVIDLFPRLGERLGNAGNELSGGEQQMLAIARALLMNPSLLILDEPTEGLAPIIVRQIHDKLQELKRAGLTMLLVEQNFGFAVSLADEISIISRGTVAWEGEPQVIRADTEVQHRWLGV